MSENSRSLLLDHFDDPYHRGGCECATHAGQAEMESTGCQLRVELAVDDNGQILEAWFDGCGCSTCEGLCSLLMGQLENRQLVDLEAESASALLVETGVELSALASPCCRLPWAAIQNAASTPLVELEEDLADGTQFGGPSLREEC